MRFLSLHGYNNVQLSKLRRMLRFCGDFSRSPSTHPAHSGHRMFGTALVDAVGPALLIGWSEAGPWMLRQIYAVCSPPAVAQSEPRLATGPRPTLPSDLLARARELDAKHRAATGRPISRDRLRDQMRIGRDRAWEPSSPSCAQRRSARWNLVNCEWRSDLRQAHPIPWTHGSPGTNYSSWWSEPAGLK